MFYPTNLSNSIVFIWDTHSTFSAQEAEPHNFYHNDSFFFFTHAPEAVEIETDISIMSIFEENIESFK